jgi:hypothetical protein
VWAHHTRHPREIDRDAAMNRVDVAFERAAHAERHHGLPVAGAKRDDFRNFLG